MSFSVVIPSKNALNLTACIEAMAACGETARVFAVDDGLPPELMVRSNVRTIQGQKPFVFGRNANIGIRTAGIDDVILLNDDALLKTSQGFTKLSLLADMHPEYGVIGAACNNVGNRNQFPQRGEGLRDDPRMVCFVCVYIPRRTISLVGLLDERYTGYGMEDDDYCLRVKKAGLKIGIYDGCFVDHLSLKSEFRGNGAGDYGPNHELFKKKWGHDNAGNRV